MPLYLRCVVGLLLATALSGCGDAEPTASESPGRSSATPSASPDGPDLAAAGGAYAVTATLLETTFPGEELGTAEEFTWEVVLDCDDAACRGTVTSSSGRTFDAQFDGKTLRLTRSEDKPHDCGDGSRQGLEKITQTGSAVVGGQDAEGAPQSLTGDLQTRSEIVVQAPDCTYDGLVKTARRELVVTRTGS